MAEGIEKEKASAPQGGVLSEKNTVLQRDLALDTITGIAHNLTVTEDDLLEAEEIAATYSVEHVREIIAAIYDRHRRDPNFPFTIIKRAELFLQLDVLDNPEKHEEIIAEMKIEAALITNNSPYAQVRAVVDNHDDPSLPVSTIRAWVIGLFFSACIAFINVFFEIRQPSIYVTSNVPQLLAFPVGKLFERILPDVGFTLFGVRHSLNPGPFNKKEHMLITLMASISKSSPYSNYIIWIQVLPHFLNQPYAKSASYQILITLSTNFIGYGLAGLARRFLVYPAYCLWPASLVTIALNSACWGEGNIPVLGPFKKLFQLSRLKFFGIAFALMFTWFWVPNIMMPALAYFSWMAWISPNNAQLTTVTGTLSGLGINPFPTFDWSLVVYWLDPLMVPLFSTLNLFVGALATAMLVAIFYYKDVYHTAYLPITSNQPFDRYGLRYNVSSILDERGIMDYEKYQAYSPAFISAGNTLLFMAFFTAYSAVITYAILYHHREIVMGFKDLWNSFRPSKRTENDASRLTDVHIRLMKRYPEVPEWWYLICLVAASGLGVAAIANWPTYTTPGVVFYGIALSLIFMVPIGIVFAMTGIEITLNVLAEFIGGAWVEGNALALSYFKVYGYVTCSHALAFSNDLKLAHYLKIPPRFTFFAQMVPALVSSFVSVGILQYQTKIEGICTAEAPFRFTCPAPNGFFTSAVLWGTIGPKRLWGVGGQYVETLVGFPIGVVVVLAVWYMGKKFPNTKWIRSIHPVVLVSGGYTMAPFNMAYIWPAVPVALASWAYVKPRFLGFWSKYNFVLSAAFSSGLAISAIIQFFGLAYNDITFPSWWGTDVIGTGCDGTGACLHKVLAPGEFFGPELGQYN